MFGKRKIPMNVKSYSVPFETTKGKDILMHFIGSYASDKALDFRIESYLREKYQTRKPKLVFEDRIGSVSANVYKKHGVLNDNPNAIEIVKYLLELKGENPEAYINLINVEEEYKGLGIGTAMMDFAEYQIARNLFQLKQPKILLYGAFVPFDISKIPETRRFYTDRGFATEKYKDVCGRSLEMIYKMLDREEVMDRPNRKDFERIL